MKIIGLRLEKYIGTQVSGHNLSFEYTNAELDKHVILGLLEDNSKVEIELTVEYGECGSGWTTASWGHYKINYVNKFNGYTHKPIHELIVDDIVKDAENIHNDVFNVDYYGGDRYYPMGGYDVNMNLFKANGRTKELRPTYVFAGKSALALKFNNDTIIFETDAYETLPEKIIADVIVLGNKYNYTIDDIMAKVENTELIMCSFNSIS